MTTDDEARTTTGRLVRTPRTILGPYFTLGKPLRATVETDDDRATFTIAGQVFNGLGQPVPHTMIETNQPEGWTRSFSGLDGAYRISTVKPIVRAGRSPHLTVLVTPGNFMIRPALTCLYFPDEDNETDELFAQLSTEQRATLLARTTDDGYAFDIHLTGESETTFFGWPGLHGDAD
ncbi:hypothetical protein ACWDYH_07855 [Nocardia goodfellowii]